MTHGDVAAQANNAILAAAFANGGDESNLKPAIKFFGATSENKVVYLTQIKHCEPWKGEVEVAIMWDFNALNYRDKIDRERFTVSIPQRWLSDLWLHHHHQQIRTKPECGEVAREYIFSDQGQINLAEGYARPIRTNVTLPKSVQDKLISNENYSNVRSNWLLMGKISTPPAASMARKRIDSPAITPA